MLKLRNWSPTCSLQGLGKLERRLLQQTPNDQSSGFFVKNFHNNITLYENSHKKKTSQIDSKAIGPQTFFGILRASFPINKQIHLQRFFSTASKSTTNSISENEGEEKFLGKRNLDEPNTEKNRFSLSLPPSTFDIVQKLNDISRPEWHLIIGAATTLGITSTITLIIPYCSGQVIDLAILTNTGSENANEPAYSLSQLTLGLFGLTAVAGTGVFIRSILLTKAGNRIVERLRKTLFASILAQEMSFLDSTQTGDLISRLSTDAILVQKAVTTEVVNALRATVMSLGSSALLFYTSPTLAVVSLCSLPPVFVAARLFGIQIRDKQTKVQEHLAQATDIAEEVFQGMRTVRQFAAEEHEIKRYSKVLGNAHNKAIEAGKTQATFDGVVHVAANGAILGVLAIGGNMVASGDMTGM